jgi:hypothetical protein
MFASASRRSSDEFLDAPTGSVFDPVGYGHSGEHDRQVGAEPTCSIWRDPFRENHTICTAAARRLHRAHIRHRRTLRADD